MKISFNNSALDTAVTLHDDGDKHEVMLETYYDNNETWHSFQSLNQLDEFIDTSIFMRNRLAKKLGAPTRRETSNGKF